VLTTIYLLFNEGYYSETNDAVLRPDLCNEAMRLNALLLASELTARPEVHALHALMCFHASRFPARQDLSGELILYDEQDDSLWDRQLISDGGYHLHRASGGSAISRFHLEAAIAYWHTTRDDTAQKWENILQLYNRLLQIQYSAVAALNRTFALGKARGYATALPEALKLRLESNPYYWSLLAEFLAAAEPPLAVSYLERAAALVRSAAERNLISRKIERITS
jgi:RNA polymerase sigma-70 factor (ECF subfamily)